jgi:DnaK suppressor protein
MSQIEIFKTKLEEELALVTADLKTFANQNLETGDWVAIPPSDSLEGADDNTNADKVEGWNERRALMSQIEVRYNDLVRALSKITNGTYGKCELSGEEIEIKRLEANPAARTNIANRERERELEI